MLLVIVATAAGCNRREPLVQHRLFVFGTVIEITLWDATDEQARLAVGRIENDFQQMQRDWHAWEPGALMDINAAIAVGKSSPVPSSLVPLIEESQYLYRLSDGLFNPAIGRLLKLWGFQGSTHEQRPPPAAEDIAALVKAAPGMDDLVLEDGVLRSRNRSVQLDFGAFAKGAAIDQAISRLREAGIENAIVNAGGDLRAIGHKGRKPWRIGVRHPQGKGVLAALEISGDEVVFTSGNYERYNEFEGVRYTHILDPRSGYPVNSIASVTVIHHDGGIADAAATALVVAGVREWPRIAQAMGIRYVMLVDERGNIHMNPEMAARVQLEGDDHHVELVKLPATDRAGEPGLTHKVQGVP